MSESAARPRCLCALLVVLCVAAAGAVVYVNLGLEDLAAALRSDPAPVVNDSSACGFRRLLMAVGLCTEDVCRVMVELDYRRYDGTPCGEGEATEALQISVWQGGAALLHEPPHIAVRTIASTGRPTVLNITGMSPGSRYTGLFMRCPSAGVFGRCAPAPSGDVAADGFHDDCVWMSTAQPHTHVHASGDPPAEIAVVAGVGSAGTAEAEPDASGIIPALNAQWPSPVLTIHLGGQVPSRPPVSARNKTYAELLTECRAVHRATWGHDDVRLLLRRGSHLMLPSPADIAEDFDPAAPWANTAGAGLRAARAALQCFYEYQWRLQEEIPPGFAARLRECEEDAGSDCEAVEDMARALPLSGLVRRGAVAVVAVDTTVSRFVSRESSALLGSEHGEAATEAIWRAVECPGDCTVRKAAVLLLSAQPLLWVPPTDRSRARTPSHPSLAAHTEKLLSETLEALGPLSSEGRAMLLSGGTGLLSWGFVCDSHRSSKCLRLCTVPQATSAGAAASASLLVHVALLAGTQAQEVSSPGGKRLRHGRAEDVSPESEQTWLGAGAVLLQEIGGGFTWRHILQSQSECPAHSGICPQPLRPFQRLLHVTYVHFSVFVAAAVVTLPALAGALVLCCRRAR